MSVLIVQIGQCGNQIGLKTFSNLYKEIINSGDALAQSISNTFFNMSSNGEITANSLMIDMEPKVIEKCKISAKKDGWNYNDNFTIFKQEGSGNNWANGFFNHGPSISDKIIEKINHISESIDYLDSVLLINSLAGGTGSGLGSYINLLIKDYFPMFNLLNLSIWPHDSGEVIVNSYNTILSISESYKASDAVFLIRNQDVYDICTNIYQNKSINFENLNHIISKQIISATMPLMNAQSNLINPWKSKSPFVDIIGNLCLDTRFKFLRVISTPEIPEEHIAFTNNSWSSIIKRGYQLLISNANETKLNLNTNYISTKSLGNMVLLRGKESYDVKGEDKLFTEEKIYKNGEVNYSISRDNHKIFKNEKHLTIINNSNFLCDDIEKNLEKAGQMMKSGAFLHQYKKYGIETEDFLDSMAITEQILFDYK